MWTEDRIQIGRELNLAVEGADVERVRTLCTEHPWLVRDHKLIGDDTWLNVAARTGNTELMKTLLDLGFNINAMRMPEKSTALVISSGRGYLDLVRLLLSRGANPNLGRP